MWLKYCSFHWKLIFPKSMVGINIFEFTTFVRATPNQYCNFNLPLFCSKQFPISIVWFDLQETRDHCWVMLSWWPLAWSQVPPYPDVAIVTSIVTMPCSLLLTGPGLITDHLLNWDNITNVMITIWNIYRTRVIYWTGWQPRFHFR